MLGKSYKSHKITQIITLMYTKKRHDHAANRRFVRNALPIQEKNKISEMTSDGDVFLYVKRIRNMPVTT